MTIRRRFISMLCLAFASTAVHAATSVAAPAMVKVPSGKITVFTCAKGVTVCPYQSYVERVVEVAAFEIAPTEVTFAEWDQCVSAGGCLAKESGWAYENRPVRPPCVEDQPCSLPFDEGWGRGKRPVIDVSWNDVQQYISWLNKETGQTYRLPTSEEWQHAAAGGSSTAFHWGAKIGKNNANCDGCGSKWDDKQTAPVASFKPNKYGIYDMTGNVQEWVASCFPSRAKGSTECNTHMYRGGAWSSLAKTVAPGNFNDAFPTLRGNYLGFRIAR